MLEVNKKQVSLKSYSLKIKTDCVSQILKNKEKVTYIHNVNILTRITDQKILCVYSCLLNNKNQGSGLYSSLSDADNRKYLSGLSLTQNGREMYFFYLVMETKICRCSCWEKGNFILVSEFKDGQTWIIWPSSLSLSLHNTFKEMSEFPFTDSYSPECFKARTNRSCWSLIIWWNLCKRSYFVTLIMWKI